MSDAPRRAKFPLRLDSFGAPKGSALVPTPSARGAPIHRQIGLANAAEARGLGLDSTAIRHRMTQRLTREGLGNPRVLEAMQAVPRHLFVDAGLANQAYEDTSLPIGHGQTISKPSVVARMLELLHSGSNARRLASLGRVLEIGTGCGYQAAVLAQLAPSVISVERLKALHDRARDNLGPNRPGHLRLVYGDGTLGHAPNAPYDSIISAAGGASLPSAWLEQLAVGGRLVAPMLDVDGLRQVLVVVDRTAEGWQRSTCEVVQFVPLKSGRER